MNELDAQAAELRAMFQQWVDIAGDKPLMPIQTNRVAMWLRKFDEYVEASHPLSWAPRA